MKKIYIIIFCLFHVSSYAKNRRTDFWHKVEVIDRGGDLSTLQVKSTTRIQYKYKVIPNLFIESRTKSQAKDDIKEKLRGKCLFLYGPKARVSDYTFSLVKLNNHSYPNSDHSKNRNVVFALYYSSAKCQLL